MSGFADLHSHVLYDLDDGARTIEDSLAMLDLAWKSGTTDIVATPHADGTYAFNPKTVEHRISELNKLVDITIHYGCDFHLQADNIQDAIANPCKYTIDHGAYLMVELPNLGSFHAAEEILA